MYVLEEKYPCDPSSVWSTELASLNGGREGGREYVASGTSLESHWYSDNIPSPLLRLAFSSFLPHSLAPPLRCHRGWKERRKEGGRKGTKLHGDRDGRKKEGEKTQRLEVDIRTHAKTEENVVRLG